MLLQGCATAAPTSTNQTGFRLTIELQDGSKIIGKSGDEMFQFRSDVLGEIKLPLEKIRSIECQPKTNSVKLATANGDALAVEFVTKEIKMEATFGNFKLPVHLIRRVRISPMGKMGRRPGLMALWAGEGNGDDVIGGNHGSLQNGARFSPGKVGQAFKLDGVPNPTARPNNGPHVQVSDSILSISGNNDFTIVLWANFSSLVGYANTGYPYGGVFISQDEGAGNMNKWYFALDGRALDFHINSPNTGPLFLVQAPFTPNLNQWYHLAVTRSDSLYTIYANGVAIGSQNDTHAIPEPNAPVKIGAAEGMYFNGLLDEVKIYNRALSAAEIQADGVEENNDEPLPPPPASPKIRRYYGQSLNFDSSFR